MDRITMLKDLLAADATNVLARYGLAMEYSRNGDTDAALAEFTILRQSNPGYLAAYQQAAQTLINAERYDEAKQMLEQGIATAQRAGNAHACSEMEGMLEEISR